MSEEVAPSETDGAIPPLQLLAWICAIIGFLFIALMIKSIAERGMDFFNRGLVELALVIATMVFAGGQWIPFLRGRSSRAVACFGAALGCFLASALIPWGWQGPNALCLVRTCEYAPLVILPREP